MGYMGGQTNYDLLILSLLRLKDEFQRIKNPKLQPLIKLLGTKSIEVLDNSEEVPSNKDLAVELGIPITKCNPLLKQLFKELLDDFEFNKPLEIDHVVHNITIMFHWEEWEKAKSNKVKDLPESLSISLKLKETPRIGEEIRFEIIPGNYFERGIVNSITHNIIGKTQQIEIIAHPFETDYERWMHLKEKYEAHQRWLNKLDHSNK